MINRLSVWPIVKDHISIKGGKPLPSGKVHRQVEVNTEGLTPAQVDALLNEIGVCARCGDYMSPFRERAGQKGSIFYSVACKITDCMGCARSRAATEALDTDCDIIKGAHQ
jgi:hypothetical protein